MNSKGENNMKKIQLKQVYRNKRFCIIHHYFTIGWYILISFKRGFAKYFIGHCRIYQDH